MLQPNINQNGSSLAELGRKPSIASANKEYKTILSNRNLRTELYIYKKSFAIIRGACNKPIPEVGYIRKRYVTFSKFCSRLVDVRDDMIPLCLKSNRQ